MKQKLEEELEAAKLRSPLRFETPGNAEDGGGGGGEAGRHDRWAEEESLREEVRELKAQLAEARQYATKNSNNTGPRASPEAQMIHDAELMKAAAEIEKWKSEVEKWKSEVAEPQPITLSLTYMTRNPAPPCKAERATKAVSKLTRTWSSKIKDLRVEKAPPLSPPTLETATQRP